MRLATHHEKRLGFRLLVSAPRRPVISLSETSLLHEAGKQTALELADRFASVSRNQSDQSDARQILTQKPD